MHGWGKWLRWTSAGLAALALAPAGAATAGAAPLRPTRTCASLATVSLGRLDAQVLSAHPQKRNGEAYCAVEGFITPETHFEVLLPLGTWRGDYLQQGCGGFCGIAGGSQSVSLTDPSRTSLSQGRWRPLLRGRLVVAADDQGHRAPTNADALWAKNDPQLRVVYGYTSEHSMARVGKALIRAFYGRGPRHSYFDGVSDGGHEALNEAQRYPRDFDGILVGAPANNLSALFGVDETWQAAVNLDASGHQILPAEKLPALHAAVIRACADRRGVIRDPRRCTFDPATLACPTATDSSSCLTPAQVQMVRREYRGPTDPRGRNLYDGGEPYGSELSWSGWLAMPAADPAAPGDTAAAGLGLNYLRYAGYWHNPPSTFGLADFPFTAAAAARLRPLGRIYNATDPDLRAFRARGGKLILYQGWADQAIPPETSLDYYRAVIRRMGGYAATRRFARLYMIPGLYHCACGDYGSGSPATHPQFMGQLTRWVERGRAPRAVRLRVVRRAPGGPRRLTVRPLNPLVGIPHNNGLNSNYHYTDKRRTYRPHNQLWCRQRGKRLVCSSRRP